MTNKNDQSMKTKIFFHIQTLTILVILAFGTLQGLQAQNPVYAELITWKYDDLSRELIVNVTTENDEGEIPAVGIPFEYFVISEGEPLGIGQAKSDDSGKAILKLEPGYDFPKDDDDFVTVTAVFDGNDEFEAAETELMFKDVVIDLEFIEEDETKYIAYSGKIINKDGDLIPLADDEVLFFVPRMFSMLKVADGWFEENGEGVSEYPTNIIGDTEGKLEVHARMLEHFDYGNVERIATVDWAKKRRLIAAEQPTRELWTPIAPLWMIITLIILLAGVWGHYIYAMYELYMIKKISKRENKK
jgi:hypothetical protein